MIIGDVCLGSARKPSEVNALKTHVLDSGRPSYLTPCDSRFSVKESFSLSQSKAISNPLPPPSLQAKPLAENLGETVFCQTSEDNLLAHSVEDLIFLKKMHCFKDDTNSWVAPLPFRSPRCLLPDNRRYAYKRLESLRHSLDKKPDMKTHFIEFMQKMLDNKHAELAPPRNKDKSNPSPNRGFYQDRHVQTSVEKSSSACRHLLGSMAKRVPTGKHAPKSSEVATQTKSERKGHCSSERQAAEKELMAHGNHHEDSSK